MAYRPKVEIQAADSPSVGAFSRWRIAEAVTLYDSKQIHDNLPLFWSTSTASGGSVTYRTNESSSRLAVNSTIGSTAIRQTKRRFNYEPGKSQLIFHTFNALGNDSGIRKRVGYFDEENGIFLELNGTDVRFVIRSFTSGSAVDTEFAVQDDWNLDKFDGSGGSGNPSGVSLDWDTVQVLVIDMQWLGVGRVRVGFDINGIVHYAHQFVHANSDTVVYMTTPNLPIRAEIVNVSSGSSSNIDIICSTVISEGGFQSTGAIRSANNGILSPIDAGTAGTRYALLGIRLKNTHLDAVVNIEQVEVVIVSNQSFIWELQLNPTVAGTFTYADETNSPVQIAKGETSNDPSTNSISAAGTILASGYSSRDVDIAKADIKSALTLGATVSGTRDQIVLCAAATANNEDFFGAITWRELI